MELVFIPNKNFECLWIFPEDNTVQPIEDFKGITFKINSIICTESSTKEINSNIDNLDGSLYGSAVVPIHFSLAPQTTASYIRIIPRMRVDVLPNLTTVPYQFRDPYVKLVAKNSILIMPDASLNSSIFEATKGSIFSASISSENTGCDDACEAYTPWYTPYHQIWWRNAINTCSSTPNIKEWRPISSYPKPYNAYYVKLSIFGRLPDGSVGSSPVFQKVWEDTQKRGLAAGIVVWRPASNLPNGVYVAHIEFTNCNGYHDEWQDITLINGCGGQIALSSDNQNITVQNPNGPAYYDNSVNNVFSISENNNTPKHSSYSETMNLISSPNPTTGLLNLSSNVDIEDANIKIISIVGVDLMQLNRSYISKNTIFQYNISTLPSGMYFVVVSVENKIVHKSKIIKL